MSNNFMSPFIALILEIIRVLSQAVLWLFLLYIDYLTYIPFASYMR
jgi:hypothetical protein